jgi:hypothetical protein
MSKSAGLTPIIYIYIYIYIYTYTYVHIGTIYLHLGRWRWGIKANSVAAPKGSQRILLPDCLFAAERLENIDGNKTKEGQGG